MPYRTLNACVKDLEKTGQLVRIDCPLDANLEIAAIQRRAFEKKSPAMLFTNVKGCKFPMLANLYGTYERIRYIFRDTLPVLEHLFAVKADPANILNNFRLSLSLPKALYNMWPSTVKKSSIMQNEISLCQLPQLRSWPLDGGAFITLPLVYSENPLCQGYKNSNLGMYRVQISGNDYVKDKEVGLHYQIHRGIAAHHAAALKMAKPLKVNIFIGGPPAMTLAAVMPLPEGLSELFFAGVLGGFRMPFVRKKDELPILASADFCISGTIMPSLKPEGPFGDHLGYYSLVHDFPYLKVDAVYHSNDAIWPFTSVGRPPQEDTIFGKFIHELTADLIPTVFAGVHEVHAVDVAGVHPLLLMIGSERYVPYAEERNPQELLTCALNVLGSSQTSLAKYVLATAHEDNEQLKASNVPLFFKHLLERTRFDRDLHFITNSSSDTLDYTGQGLNKGSKLIWLAAGSIKRQLAKELPVDFKLPEGFDRPVILDSGILLIRGQAHKNDDRYAQDLSIHNLAKYLENLAQCESLPLIVIADEPDFAAKSWENFLWVTFTRSDPARDIYGVNAFTQNKHWGCKGSLLIDARLKSFQAPPLVDDENTENKINALAVRGGPLYGYI